jgi:hypothetical protein
LSEAVSARRRRRASAFMACSEIVARPCRYLPLRRPVGAPGDVPPCMRHRPFRIAGPRQGKPDRHRAPHRRARQANSKPCSQPSAWGSKTVWKAICLGSVGGGASGCAITQSIWAITSAADLRDSTAESPAQSSRLHHTYADHDTIQITLAKTQSLNRPRRVFIRFPTRRVSGLMWSTPVVT